MCGNFGKVKPIAFIQAQPRYSRKSGHHVAQPTASQRPALPLASFSHCGSHPVCLEFASVPFRLRPCRKTFLYNSCRRPTPVCYSGSCRRALQSQLHAAGPSAASGELQLVGWICNLALQGVVFFCLCGVWLACVILSLIFVPLGSKRKRASFLRFGFVCSSFGFLLVSLCFCGLCAYFHPCGAGPPPKDLIFENNLFEKNVRILLTIDENVLWLRKPQLWMIPHASCNCRYKVFWLCNVFSFLTLAVVEEGGRDSLGRGCRRRRQCGD
jgi:hypothetical protein